MYLYTGIGPKMSDFDYRNVNVHYRICPCSCPFSCSWCNIIISTWKKIFVQSDIRLLWYGIALVRYRNKPSLSVHNSHRNCNRSRNKTRNVRSRISPDILFNVWVSRWFQKARQADQYKVQNLGLAQIRPEDSGNVCSLRYESLNKWNYKMYLVLAKQYVL
jgi:hypothetical protein